MIRGGRSPLQLRLKLEDPSSYVSGSEVTSRLERLLGTATPATAALEIGARDAPLLRKPQHDVRYVDYAPTEVVKANQFDPAIRIEEIVDVDLVWGDEPLVALNGRQVDYVVASHVIEHVPDPIGWLQEIADVLRPNGVLGLAIPDKRFTFDALRKTSVLSEAVEAYLTKSRQPTLRQVFDAAALGIPVDVGQVWDGAFEPSARRNEVLGRLRPALNLARRLHADPQYRDAHCWVFTPGSFLDLVEELSVLGLFPFRVDGFFPTEPGTLEFQVRLVKTDTASSDIRASIAAARSGSALSREPSLAPAGPPDHDGTVLLASKVVRLERSLASIEASRSWKLTAPLRVLRRLTSEIWRAFCRCSDR